METMKAFLQEQVDAEVQKLIGRGAWCRGRGRRIYAGGGGVYGELMRG